MIEKPQNVVPDLVKKHKFHGANSWMGRMRKKLNLFPEIRQISTKIVYLSYCVMTNSMLKYIYTKDKEVQHGQQN